MKKLLIPFLALALYAETPKVSPPAVKAPEITDNEVAQLYKALAEKTAAEVNAKEKLAAFAEFVKRLEAKCGGSLVEVPGKLVACAPPVAPAKDTAK